ncbi:hypothetical protein SK128_025037 [Halocaridina rubra]|uniref:Ubiquitin-associated protein 1 n=1 Tax=Halocaridina rubra TaxID=373956 RepID=A0AAN8X9R1_HALRR
MSTDPAAFVAGVPVKISERFRPPRKVTLPVSCQHHINTDLLTQEYDFAVEKTTLNWVQERKQRLEREETERRARIEEYERLKAEKKAKEEEERLQFEQEAERQKALREEEEKKKEEEEEQRVKDEERKREEEALRTEQSVPENGEDMTNSELRQSLESNESEESSETQVSSKDNVEGDVQAESIPPSTILPPPESGNSLAEAYMGNATFYTSNTPYRADTKITYPDMLKPTPIPSQKDKLGSPVKSPANINFADFEGDANDPFDSAALKSINDLEELAKVLDSTNVSSSQGNDKFASKVNPAEVYPNGQTTTYNAYSQYPYYMPQQQPQNFGPFANHIAKTPHVTSSASPTVPSYTSNPQYVGEHNRPYQNPYYNQQWNSNYNVSSPSKHPQYGAYDYHLQNSMVNKTVSGLSPGSTSASISTAPGTRLPAVPAERGNPAKRQDLEDFYTKYYSQNKSSTVPAQQSGARSGDSTPSHSSGSGAAGSTSGSLRSCRSVPDLTAAEDSEVTSYNSQIQSQNEGGRIFSHTPPPRPSSTGLSGLEDWKPLPDLPGDSPETTSPHQHTPAPIPIIPVKSRLPDPFTELTSDAQNLVQSMAEMGFPRPRVARAVQKLGTDHKKLIEVLLVLQSLQDTGEDEYMAEFAFYYYMGDLQKTRDHLSAAKQLLDLGFEEDRIIDALLKHNNDRDKALEELIA